MKPPDVALRELVLQWLDKAAADFDAAEQLSTQSGRFREIVAFHCQQAAEKYLKALLVRRQVEFPKTHDIAKLLDRVATVDVSTAESPRGADSLTPFGVDARYPSDAPEVLPGGEVEAIAMARMEECSDDLAPAIPGLSVIWSGLMAEVPMPYKSQYACPSSCKMVTARSYALPVTRRATRQSRRRRCPGAIASATGRSASR
jgi:HEPN domain-containing protein